MFVLSPNPEFLFPQSFRYCAHNVTLGCAWGHREGVRWCKGKEHMGNRKRDKNKVATCIDTLKKKQGQFARGAVNFDGNALGEFEICNH